MPARQIPASSIQAPPPEDAGNRRRSHVISLEQVHPLIRIAHRRRSASGLAVPDRIIFDHEIVFIEQGSGRFVSQELAVPFDAGTLLLIRPFLPHRFEGNKSVPTVHLAVHFDLAPQIPGPDDRLSQRPPYEVRFPRGRQLPPVMQVPPKGELARTLAQVVSLREADDELSAAEAGSGLLRILLTMFRASPDLAAPPAELDARLVSRLERAVSWIQANLHRDIGVADVADVAGFSQSHLNRLFVEWTGYSPRTFIRRARIAQARKLLADVDLSIKQVAFRTGFKDQYHFSKTFRQIDGLSPSLYREALFGGRSTP